MPFIPMAGRIIMGYVVLPKAVYSNEKVFSEQLTKSLAYASSLPQKEKEKKGCSGQVSHSHNSNQYLDRGIIMSRGAALKIVVAITGASGTAYGCRLLEMLQESNAEVMIIVTDLALEILKSENGIGIKDLSKFGKVFRNDDMKAPTSSGSHLFDALIVVPCSMKTLASIANGLSFSLVARTADVALKERRKVILVTRETPLSLIHIRNMEKATESGAVILPACPGFYHNPSSVAELVDYIVGKVLDQLGIENDLFRRWGEEK